MAPDIPKINADRQFDPGLPAWNFRDEVMRRLFHGNSLPLPEDLLIPFPVTDPHIAIWITSGLPTTGKLTGRGEFESLPWRKRHDADVNKTGPTKTGRSAIGGLLTSANDDPRRSRRNSFRIPARVIARFAVAAFASGPTRRTA